MVSIIVHLSVLSFCNYCPLLPYETDGGPANFPFRAYYELSKVHGTVISKSVIKQPSQKVVNLQISIIFGPNITQFELIFLDICTVSDLTSIISLLYCSDWTGAATRA
jgi:hypothetical protein